MPNISDKWNLVNLPPEGHKDVGPFMWNLFDLARDERDRLMLPERWMENYKLYRGDHWQKDKSKKDQSKVTINLFFANVERTKANVTARNPIAEVVDLDGDDDGSANLLTAKNRKWWKDTSQKQKLGISVLAMEQYGITIEKAYYDFKKQRGDISIVDPYAFFPAPGNWEDISLDCPYICHGYPELVEAVEKMFNVSGVEPDDVYSLLGEEREEKKPIPSASREGAARYDGTYNKVEQSGKKSFDIRQGRTLVIEIWIRDYSTEKVDEPILDEETGEPLVDEETGDILIKEIEVPKYPGGIRVITLTGSGSKTKDKNIKQPIVLDDKPNPNINPELPPEATQYSYLYDHFPFTKVNSYEDTTNIWGFSAAEQVGDLNYKIDELISKVGAWAARAMFPPLIIPKNCGITREMINNKPNLVLMPTNVQASQFIRFETVPNLPANFFTILDMFINFFDRVYQIEDADRGVGPKGVVAASAIVALQERNAVLIQHKIEMVDNLIEFRGKCNISFTQNFGIKYETLEVEGETKGIIGVNLVGRKFNYVVESGSTMPKTSLQVAAQAEKYYQLGAIDRQALLEHTGFPGWKQIIERAGEGQLDQALQILIAAGMQEEDALALRQYLLEPQGGPGNRPQEGAGTQKVSAGNPREAQGGKPPQNVERKEE